MYTSQRFIVLFIGLSFFLSLSAQTKNELLPLTFSESTTTINTIQIASDKSRETPTKSNFQHLPTVGYCIRIDIDFFKKATQLKQDDKTIFLLKIIAPKAKGLVPYFSQFSLSGDATLHLYSPDKSEIIGAFTSQNKTSDGYYSTGLFMQDTLILQYATSSPTIIDKIYLSELGYAYRELGVKKSSREFGDAQSCEVNVNCAEGNLWQNQKRAAVRILVKAGADFGWCSGTLVNNTSQDCTPYILSADHCSLTSSGGYSSAADFSQWVYYFNYESPSCTNPLNEGILANQFITGSSLVAQSRDNGGDTGSDFLLTKMTLSPPLIYNAYYAGWDRNNTRPDSGACIHHPNADIKKISTFKTKTTSTSWGGSTSNTHHEVLWASTANGWGITEEGSSGSALYNPNRLVVGTLTGGGSFCTTPTEKDAYGKLYHHWDKNATATNRQLKPWLDPTNTGALTLAGRNACGQVGIADTQNEEDWISVYPNPSNGTIHLNIRKTGRIVLYAIDGRILQEWDSVSENMLLQNLASGYYLLQATNENKTQTMRLIVQ